MDYNEVKKVLKKEQKKLLKKKGVVATGIGYNVVNGVQTDELVATCSVEKKLPGNQIKKKDFIPTDIEGVHTDVVEIGIVKALNTDKHRPILGGISTAHAFSTAGTLACIVKKNGENYILSNAHVLALSNDAKIGDPILQPSPYDKGVSIDRVGQLSEYVPISFIGEKLKRSVFTRMIDYILRVLRIRTKDKINLVDAALAKVDNSIDVANAILNIGDINGIGVAKLGMKIRKHGRTTGLTYGVITQTDVTINVQYGDKTATFTDQLLAGCMSAGGDSGSVVLDSNNNIVSLLFAGSPQVTIMNRIEHVVDLLHIANPFGTEK